MQPVQTSFTWLRIFLSSCKEAFKDAEMSVWRAVLNEWLPESPTEHVREQLRNYIWPDWIFRTECKCENPAIEQYFESLLHL